MTFSGRIAGRGVVVVDHGAMRTTYEPVSATVRIGDVVSAGTTIGRLELFGSHCFPDWCLHWGLIRGRDHYLDPLSLVGAAPVILLPLGPAPPSGSAAARLLAQPAVPAPAWFPPMILRPTSRGALSLGPVSLGLPAPPAIPELTDQERRPPEWDPPEVRRAGGLADTHVGADQH